MTRTADLPRIVLSHMEKLRNNHASLHFLMKSLESIGEVAVVGGAARDWLLGREPRDIDLVVDGDPSLLATAIEWQCHRRTRYGGYHLRLPAISVDVWSLKETWAFRRRGTQKPELELLPSTAFYNWDAVVVSLSDGCVYECGFNEGFDRQVLWIVFEENPQPALCAVRGLSLAKKYNLRLDRQVIDYMFRISEEGIRWEKMNEAQLSHYGRALVNVSDVDKLLPSCLSRVILINV